jgi:hypothetical protein
MAFLGGLKIRVSENHLEVLSSARVAEMASSTEKVCG